MLPGKSAGLKELIRPYYLKWIYFPSAAERCPPEFKRWRECLSVPLKSADQIVPPAENSLLDLIFFPMNDWHGIRQRSQQLAHGLSTLGHRCFYLNPHLGREFPQVYPLSQRSLVSLLEPRVVELHIHLPREPVFHHRSLRLTEMETVSMSVLGLLEAARSERQVSILGFPLWTGVAVRLRQERKTPIVYDCHDLLEGFGDIGKDLLDQEAELLEVADLVVFSADWLAKEHISRNPRLVSKSAVIRNGVDSKHFEGVAKTAGNGPVTIGYIGALNSWFDVEAVKAAAAQHPEWRFLLVGPVGFQFPKDAFQAQSNVHLVGEIGYRELPQWMSKFDIGTIPFLIRPLTKATNPIKLYEYFACGLPVVSSQLEEVARYPELTYLANNSGDFVRQLERAVQEDDAGKRAERRKIARQENWISRSEALMAAVSHIPMN